MYSLPSICFVALLLIISQSFSCISYNENTRFVASSNLLKDVFLSWANLLLIAILVPNFCALVHHSNPFNLKNNLCNLERVPGKSSVAENLDAIDPIMPSSPIPKDNPNCFLSMSFNLISLMLLA